MLATINDRGNGFPSVGDYVAGDDGNLYEVTSLSAAMHTGGAGCPNYIYGEVRLADWGDIGENEEPICDAVLSGDEGG